MISHISLFTSRIAKFFQQKLPLHRDSIFERQKDILQRFLITYRRSPLYQKILLKQENIRVLIPQELKDYIAQYEIIQYGDHIYSLLQEWRGITAEYPDLFIKTSGTSDARQWWKLIPAQKKSFRNENIAIKRTLCCYLQENWSSKLLFPSAFALTAPFDHTTKIGYVSGAIQSVNPLSRVLMFPSQKTLSLPDPNKKREHIIHDLLHTQPTIRSFHGVPAWPLGIVDELISREPNIARSILQSLEYISIGWGNPSDYKLQYEKRIRSLWLNQQLYGSNNHNASEWFFGAQVRNFGDLQFQGMAPLFLTNFFLFVTKEDYTKWKSWQHSSSDMIRKSYLLHEVQSDREYFMFIANDRIPWLYDLKDRVIFLHKKEWISLEYLVVGRYSMSSNIMNEHVESDHIQAVLSHLQEQWYQIDKEAFVAWLEVNEEKTSSRFHILIEGDCHQNDILIEKFDEFMGVYNEQWKVFRQQKRIADINFVVQPYGFIRSTMMKLELSHEQSKIPYLSDGNYEAIVKPLLDYEKRVR